MQWDKLIKKEAAEILSSKNVKKAVEEAKELVSDIEKTEAAKEMKGASALGDSVKGALNATAKSSASELSVKIPAWDATIYRARYPDITDDAFKKIVDNIKTKDDLEYLEMLSNLNRKYEAKEYSWSSGIMSSTDTAIRESKTVQKQDNVVLNDLDEIFLLKERPSKKFLEEILNLKKGTSGNNFLLSHEDISYVLKNINKTNKDVFDAWVYYNKNKNISSGMGGYGFSGLPQSIEFGTFKRFLKKADTQEKKEIIINALTDKEWNPESRIVMKYIDSKLDAPKLVSKIEENFPGIKDEHPFAWRLETFIENVNKNGDEELFKYLDCKNPKSPDKYLYDFDDIFEIANHNLSFDDRIAFDKLRSMKHPDGETVLSSSSAALIAKTFKTEPSSVSFFNKTLPLIEAGEGQYYELNYMMENFSQLKNNEYFYKLYSVAQKKEQHDFRIIRAFLPNDGKIIDIFDKTNAVRKKILDNFIKETDIGINREYCVQSISSTIEKASEDKAFFTAYKYLMKEKLNGAPRFNYDDMSVILQNLGEKENAVENLEFLKKLMPYKNSDKTARFTSRDMAELLSVKNEKVFSSGLIEDTISQSKDFCGENFEPFWVAAESRFIPPFNEKKLFDLINLKKQDGTYLIKADDLHAVFDISGSIKPSVVMKFVKDGRFAKDDLIAIAHAYKNTDDKSFFNKIFNIKELSAENIYDIVSRANESNKDIPWERIAKTGAIKESRADRFLFNRGIDEINYISRFYHGDSVELHKNFAKLLDNDFYSNEAPEKLKSMMILNYDLPKNKVDWLKKLLSAKANGKPLKDKEINLLNTLGRSAIYDAHHGRSSIETSMSDLNKVLDGWLDSKKDFSFETLSTKDKFAFLNYSKDDIKLGELTSNLPMFNFLRKFEDSKQLKDELIQNLKKELLEPGRDLALDKNGAAKLINGKFETEMKNFDFITTNALQKYHRLLASPDFNTKLNPKDRNIAKFAALFDGLDENELQCAIKARNILEKNKMTSEITERVFNLIHNKNWYELYQKGKIDEADIAVIFRQPNDFEIAKILSGKDYSKNNEKDLVDKIEEILNQIYANAPIVKPTRLPYNKSKIPTMSYKGRSYKVIDLRDPSINLEKLGFAKGTTKDNMRFLTHFYKSDNNKIGYSSSSPDMIKILSDEVNESSLSAAVLDVFNQSNEIMGRNDGFILEPMATNYAVVFNDDFVSPLKKGFAEFKQYLTGQLSSDERKFLPDFYKQKLKLSDDEYAQLFKKTCSFDDISRLKKDIKLTTDDGAEKVISADDLRQAIVDGHKKLMPQDTAWNESIVQNVKPKAPIHKMSDDFEGTNILDDVPSDTLRYLEEHDVPIVIF